MVDEVGGVDFDDLGFAGGGVERKFGAGPGREGADAAFDGGGGGGPIDGGVGAGEFGGVGGGAGLGLGGGIFGEGAEQKASAERGKAVMQGGGGVGFGDWDCGVEQHRAGI